MVGEIEKSPSGSQRKKTIWRLVAWWLLTMTLSLLLGLWLAKLLLFPAPLEPVRLAAQEARVLEQKLAGLRPERYEERAGSREILLSERELNALISRNPEFARRLAIHLDQDLASATLLVPVDKSFPVFGGTTLRISAGLELHKRDERPVVILRGVSLWGVPLPNSWLGGIKHLDLVDAFGGEPGFWAALADGIAEVEVQRGQLRILLHE